MQVVPIEAADGLGLEAVMAPLEAILEQRGSVGRILADGEGGVHVSADTATIQFDGTGDAQSTPLDRAIDQLAADGHDYALVAGTLVDDNPAIAVGEHEAEATIASLDAKDLEDETRLAPVVDAIDDLEPIETLASLVRAIQDHPDSPKAGALATFTGRVRAENLDEGRTTHLEYEKYDGVAETELEAIREELTDRAGVFEVLMHHNTGVVPAEADAVHVVVLAGHRAEAFRAVEDGIDLLKERVPIFKKEVTESGEHWAHDRP